MRRLGDRSEEAVRYEGAGYHRAACSEGARQAGSSEGAANPGHKEAISSKGAANAGLKRPCLIANACTTGVKEGGGQGVGNAVKPRPCK